MRTPVRIGLMLTALAVLALFFIQRQGWHQASTPAINSSYTIITKLPETTPIPAFSLLDQYGETFDAERLKGQWSLLFFGFTRCPDICPPTMATLRRFVAQFPNPPQVVLVSVDPENDTPEILDEYLAAFNEDFIGVTGAREEMVALSTFFGLVAAPPHGSREDMPEAHAGHDEHANHQPASDSYTINHSGSIIVVNPDGEYAGRISPPLNADELAWAWPDFIKEN